jgi:hypothetical protein
MQVPNKIRSWFDRLTTLSEVEGEYATTAVILRLDRGIQSFFKISFSWIPRLRGE